MGKIEGTVTLDGQPLKSGSIIFTVKGTRDASGTIENGVIKNVMTFVDGDGVPVGQASVAIIAMEEIPTLNTQPAVDTSDPSIPAPPSNDMNGMGNQKFSIPVHYTNPETSGLTATIEKGTNQLKFELKSN
ncbi:MAG: hypothetical protein LBJ00_17390 [Planctomycetaceae bacterium]|nr:hypothetical protein [Planctomycetaceae bacterium]